VVQAAAGGLSRDADAALARLCECYWYPLYAYLRSHGHSSDDAQDLTQAFFVHLLEKRGFRQADPARGRFRSFLLASLKNFAVNQWERGSAQKRGGRFAKVPLDGAEGRFLREPQIEDTPDRIFDRTWALTLIDRVIGRLRDELVRSGRPVTHVDRFVTYLLPDQPQPGYADTANALGMTEEAVKVAVHRMRRKFRDLMVEEIAHTVASPDDIDDEVRYLRNAVAR
jgi:DNA-directed RNA polymerase specialized sigma24 family protein